MPLVKPETKYTYQDYLTWDDEERWEIIEGVPCNMAPAPALRHQLAAGNFHTLLKNKLAGEKCIPFYSPADVILSGENVVQPDVFVVCDPKKITEKNIRGAPDLVFEVLSPSTERKDRWEKKRVYEKFGVREYILLDLDAMYAERFLLQEDGEFDQGEVFGKEGAIQLKSLDNLEIHIKEILEFPDLQDSTQTNEKKSS